MVLSVADMGIKPFPMSQNTGIVTRHNITARGLAQVKSCMLAGLKIGQKSVGDSCQTLVGMSHKETLERAYQQTIACLIDSHNKPALPLLRCILQLYHSAAMRECAAKIRFH